MLNITIWGVLVLAQLRRVGEGKVAIKIGSLETGCARALHTCNSSQSGFRYRAQCDSQS